MDIIIIIAVFFILIVIGSPIYLSLIAASLVYMIMNPGIDGLETYQRILATCPQQRALLVSGFSETERVRAALDLGAGAYLKKPYRMVDLARAVESVLDRQAAVDT